MRFFTGLHQPSDARHFASAFISVNRLRGRATPERVEVRDWIMDSGAFTEVSRHGGYRSTPADYAREVRRWVKVGNLLACVAQDFMCESWILERTGLSVPDHQRLTIERYDALLAADPGVYVLPVLQGYSPGEYVDHIEAYGARLPLGAWVGVGSVCKRNASVLSILRVLTFIRDARPDLRLHGFGLKSTALAFEPIREMLHSADSMAWSFAARRQGRNPNDWREARDFTNQLTQPQQLALAV